MHFHVENHQTFFQKPSVDSRRKRAEEELVEIMTRFPSENCASIMISAEDGAARDTDARCLEVLLHEALLNPVQPHLVVIDDLLHKTLQNLVLGENLEESSPLPRPPLPPPPQPPVVTASTLRYQPSGEDPPLPRQPRVLEVPRLAGSLRSTPRGSARLQIVRVRSTSSKKTNLVIRASRRWRLLLLFAINVQAPG